METVEIDYDELLILSSNATLFKIDDEVEVWIPCTLMVEYDEDDKTFTIPEWFAIKKDLI